MDNFSFSILNEQSIKFLKSIQRKYENYFTFFVYLTKIYKGTKQTAEMKKVDNILLLIGDLNNLIEKIMNRTGNPAKEEIDQFFNLIKELKESINYFSKKGLGNLSKAMQDRIAQAEKETNINLEDLVKSAEIIGGRVNKMRREAANSILAGTVDILGTIGGQLVNTMLGPLGTVIAGGRDVYKYFREKKITAQNRALENELFSPKERSSTNVKAGRSLGNLGMGNENVGEGIEKGMAVDSLGVGAALFTFFQFDAFKAAWTRDLLNAIRKIANLGPGKSIEGIGKGGLPFALSIPSGFFTKLAYTLGVAVAGGLALYYGGKWAINDMDKYQKKMIKEGTFTGVPGKPLNFSQDLFSKFGTFYGGGPGVYQKGGLKNVVQGTGKGAAIGVGTVALGALALGIPVTWPLLLAGLLTGGVMMGAGHAAGGELLSHGIQSAWKSGPLGQLIEGIEGFKKGGFEGAARNIESAATFGLLPNYEERNNKTGKINTDNDVIIPIKTGFEDVVTAIDNLSLKMEKKPALSTSFSSGNFQATGVGDKMIEFLSMGFLDTE